MNEVINLIDIEIIKLSESLRKYKILQQSFKDEGSENDTVNLIIKDYTERIYVCRKSIEILKQALSESQSVSDNETKREILIDFSFWFKVKYLLQDRKPCYTDVDDYLKEKSI